MGSVSVGGAVEVPLDLQAAFQAELEKGKSSEAALLAIGLGTAPAIVPVPTPGPPVEAPPEIPEVEDKSLFQKFLGLITPPAFPSDPLGLAPLPDPVVEAVEGLLELAPEAIPEVLAGSTSEVAGVATTVALTPFVSPLLSIPAGIAVEGLVETFIEPRLLGAEIEPAPQETSLMMPAHTDLIAGRAIPRRDVMLWVRVNPLTRLPYGKTVDGRMVYMRKDGQITVYRPEKPIVLTRNPRLKDAARAAKRLKSFGKRLRKTALKDFL